MKNLMKIGFFTIFATAATFFFWGKVLASPVIACEYSFGGSTQPIQKPKPKPPKPCNKNVAKPAKPKLSKAVYRTSLTPTSARRMNANAAKAKKKKRPTLESVTKAAIYGAVVGCTSGAIDGAIGGPSGAAVGAGIGATTGAIRGALTGGIVELATGWWNN